MTVAEQAALERGEQLGHALHPFLVPPGGSSSATFCRRCGRGVRVNGDRVSGPALVQDCAVAPPPKVAPWPEHWPVARSVAIHREQQARLARGERA